MKNNKLILLAVISAAVVTFSGCTKRPANPSDSDSSQSQSENSSTEDKKDNNDGQSKNEKPPVLKEGTVIHMEKRCANEEKTLIHEEIYNEYGKILKYTDNTFAADKEITYEYDANGNLIKETNNFFDDGKYRKITEYNENGLVLKESEIIIENDHSVFDHSYTYEYDEAGNPVICNDEKNHKAWERVYENGKLKKQTDYLVGINGYYVSSETEFDADENKSKYTKYDKDGAVTRQTEYNSSGKITTDHGDIFGSSDVSDLVNEYDSSGYLVKTTVSERGSTRVVVYENDSEGNSVHDTVYLNDSACDENRHSFDYEYDKNGNISKITEYASNSKEPLYYTTYEYFYKD